MTYLLSFLAFWLACGFVAALIERGVYVTSHPFAAVMFGPVALLSVSIDAFVYGWRKWW